MKARIVTRAILLMLLLLACAVASVLVAWGCARWDEHHPPGRWEHTAVTDVPQETREYLCDPSVDAGFGPDRKCGFSKTVQWSIACTTVEYSRWHDSDWFMGYSRTQSSRRYGFPFRSMQRIEQEWSDPAAYPEFEIWRLPDARGGWPIAPGPARQQWPAVLNRPPAHVYPITPLPLGIAMDALTYALAILTIVKGPKTVRTWLCRRRKLCPKCAYPRGTSPVCTECGQRL